MKKKISLSSLGIPSALCLAIFIYALLSVCQLQFPFFLLKSCVSDFFSVVSLALFIDISIYLSTSLFSPLSVQLIVFVYSFINSFFHLFIRLIDGFRRIVVWLKFFSQNNKIGVICPKSATYQ